MTGKRIGSDVGRFAIVPEWLLDLASPGAVKLFAVMGAKYADREGMGARPSRRRLAEDLGISMPTIDRLIRELVALGAVDGDRRTSATGANAPTEYRLRLARQKLSLVTRDAITSEGIPDHLRGGMVKNGDRPSIAIDPESRSRISDPEAPSAATLSHATTLYAKVWPGRRRPAVDEYLGKIDGEHVAECLTWAFGEIALTTRPTLHRLDGILEQCAKIGHGPRDRWYESDRPKGVDNGDGTGLIHARRNEIARRPTTDDGRFAAADGWRR